MTDPRVGVVAIGRNEGERLKACLRSVVGLGPVVYVDSGSTDGSQDFARSIGVELVELAIPPGFTAARARNEGFSVLVARHPGIELIQFVDGDCEVHPAWLGTGSAALDADPQLGVVFGRLRERHPEHSIYNALADDEWNVPVGDVGACPGNILIRRRAFEDAGGYTSKLIAGEEPDMSMRLRAAGWRLRRIEPDMALHDTAMLHFGQWWRRTRRGGHAAAELAWRHPGCRWPDWKAMNRRAIRWGGVLPTIALAGVLLAIVADCAWLMLPLAVLALFALNVVRLYRRRSHEGLEPRIARASAFFLMVGKLPEFLGYLEFHRNRRRGRASTIIEYKSTA